MDFVPVEALGVLLDDGNVLLDGDHLENGGVSLVGGFAKIECRGVRTFADFGCLGVSGRVVSRDYRC